MRHIAIFTNHEIGGAVTSIYSFMRVFRQNNYTIDLYRFNHAGESFLPLSTIATNTYNYDLKFYSSVTGRLPAIREYVNLFNYWRSLRNLDALSQKMARDIDSRHYDFVFANIDQYVKIPHVVKYLKTPTFLYLQEPERIFFDPPALFNDELDEISGSLFKKIHTLWYFPANSARNKIHKYVSDTNLKRCANPRVLVNSYFSADSVFRAYNIMPKVCYHGIDTSWLKPISRERENFVLTVGSLTPNKGHAFLVKALGVVPKQFRPKFIVVADAVNPQRGDALLMLAKKHEVDLVIKQNVPRSELADLYARASLFIYGSRLEPFGLAPLEAMAAGTPVVAIRSGGVQETVVHEKTGILVDWDIEAFGQQVYNLMTDKNLWLSLSQAGPGYVAENWNWDKAYRRFENLLQDAESHENWH